MNRKFLCILGTALLIILVVSVQITQMQNSQKSASRYNEEYEKYLNQEFYGTDVISIINKAINSNEQNNVEKDEDGNYIENDTDSIKVYVHITVNDKVYTMESISKVGIDRFAKNFNLLNFTCSRIEYHQSTGKISQIYIEQTEDV